MTDLQDVNAKIAALETKDSSDTIRMTVKELLLLLRAYRCEVARADALAAVIKKAILHDQGGGE